MGTKEPRDLLADANIMQEALWNDGLPVSERLVSLALNGRPVCHGHFPLAFETWTWSHDASQLPFIEGQPVPKSKMWAAAKLHGLQYVCCLFRISSYQADHLASYSSLPTALQLEGDEN
jgi:hypothetical protein